MLRALCVELESGEIDVLGLDMPCASWSSARRWDGGPPPLRGDDWDASIFTGDSGWGRQDLRRHDQDKASEGNYLLLMTCILCVSAFLNGVPGYIENPASSRVWKSPLMKVLLHAVNGTFHTVSFCRYGTQWRKDTTFMTWLLPADSWAPRRCSTPSGRCVRSGKRHVLLSGKVKQTYKTLIAQPYPFELCHDLMSAFLRIA